MKFYVKISKEAKEDLREIYTYIAEELLSPEVAINQLKRIEAGILSLDNMPTRHRIYDKDLSSCIRFFPVNNYCIFYLVDEKDAQVHIVRVLYGGRNFTDVL